MKFVKVGCVAVLGGALIFGLTGCASWGARQNKRYEQQKRAAQKYSTQADQIKESAYSGDPDAEYALGYMYYYGKNGLERDPEVGQQWIAKAAEQGQPQAVEAIALLQQAQHPEAAYTTTSSPSSQPIKVVNSVKTTKTPPIQKVLTKAKEVNIKPSSSKVVLTSAERTLLKEPRNSYTLQLLGRNDEQVINQFVERYGLLAKTKIYHTHFREDDWYVLTYGIFKSDHEASEAIKKLPKNLQKLDPWVKPISMVQAEILQGTDQPSTRKVR